VEFGFDFRVLAEEIPGPCKGVGYGFVTGEEDGEDFVADLLVGHACVLRIFFVAGGEEHGEEIAFVYARGFVFGDEAVDYGVEAGFGFAKFDEARDGQMEEGFEFGEGDDEVVEVHDCVDLVVDAADVVGDLGVEEGAGYDLEREGHHGGADVDGLAGLPAVAVGCGAGYDLVSVGGDALAMEGRGGDAALADVNGIVGGDEAFAEEDLHAADGALLDETGALIDEDLADVFGVVDEDDGGAHEAIVGDVAVGGVEVFEEEDGGTDFDPGFAGVEGEGVFQAWGHPPRACRRSWIFWIGGTHVREAGNGARSFGWVLKDWWLGGHGVATGVLMREATSSRMRVWMASMEASSRIGMTRLGSRAAISSYFW